MRFDLVDLRLVLNVAEAASITRGAARSNLALASASERIRDMEQALGSPLFERHRRGVNPTPAGHALLAHARSVIEQVGRMQGELAQFAKGIRGRVRIMSNTAATLEVLPPLLGSFLARHPTVDIELDERPSPEIVRAVAGGRADLGIVADAVDAAATLETRPLADDRLVLVTPARHPLARRRRVAFHEALDLDFVGLAGRALQSHIDDQAARAGRHLRVRITMSSFEAACRVVESGIGVAVVSERAARRCRKAMRIGIVSLTDPWASRRLRLCARSFSALPLHARALVEHLGQSL